MLKLPRDLEEEILCRVPAASLKRLRSTCKPLNRLFKDDEDGSFAEKHSDKAAKQFLVLMQTKFFRICPLSVNLHGEIGFKNDLTLVDPRARYSQLKIYRVFHCNGLLLCAPKDESRVVVWNPCTGQTRWIQPGGDPRKKGRDYVLGYHQDGGNSKKSYKILKFGSVGKDSEMYEFNSGSWRNLDHDIAPGWSLSYCDQSVSLKGKVYMFARDATGTELGKSLLRFDFSTEKSQRVPLPCQFPSYETAILSVVREEKLSVLLQHEITSETEIWVTNKIDETNADVSWRKVLALDLGPDLRVPYHGSFLLDEDEKSVMCCQRWIDPEDETSSTDKVYIVSEDNTTVAEDDFGVDAEENGCYPYILHYVPSLVQVQRPRRKRTRSDYRNI